MVDTEHLDRIQDMLCDAFTGRSWDEIRRCLTELARLAQNHGQLELCLQAQSAVESLRQLPDACPLGAEFPWARELAERLQHLRWLTCTAQVR